MELLGHNSLLMQEKSMDFLWAKQTAILDNISNAETPNYKTKVVTFEENLREKLEEAQQSRTPRIAVREALEQARIGAAAVDRPQRQPGLHVAFAVLEKQRQKIFPDGRGLMTADLGDRGVPAHQSRPEIRIVQQGHGTASSLQKERTGHCAQFHHRHQLFRAFS